jgi:hypothetical protein
MYLTSSSMCESLLLFPPLLLLLLPVIAFGSEMKRCVPEVEATGEDEVGADWLLDGWEPEEFLFFMTFFLTLSSESVLLSWSGTFLFSYNNLSKTFLSNATNLMNQAIVSRQE